MQINLEHLHYWMCAIRESKDPMRTMDAFWRGQMQVKGNVKSWPNVDIHGGWVGVLASMLFQSGMYIDHINSIDIDPECEATATLMNQLEFQSGRFKAYTADMCTFRSDADIVVNTSCEHITQDNYDLWLSGMPYNSLLVLQSNDYDIPEHIRTATDLEHFKEQCHLEKILYAGELNLPLYKRFMIIGMQ